MGQYIQSTKTLSLAAGATGRVWAAPSGMPVHNTTISVTTQASMPVNQVTQEVFLGGYWTTAAPYTASALHFGGTSQGAAAALAGEGGNITSCADAGDATHVIVNSAGHTLVDGNWVSLNTLLHYDGFYEVSSVVAGVSFEVVAVWNATTTGTWAKYMQTVEVIFEDASMYMANSPSAPPSQTVGGFPVVVEFVNGSLTAMVLNVTFGCETIGTNV